MEATMLLLLLPIIVGLAGIAAFSLNDSYAVVVLGIALLICAAGFTILARLEYVSRLGGHYFKG